MAEKAKKPAIRFKGFTDDWEKWKFSEITFPAGEKNKENLPLESYSITNEQGFIPQDEKFQNGGTMREADKRMYYIVTPNSFAYNPARINVGSIGYLNTSKNVIVSSLYEVFKTTDDVDDRLLWHWFKSSNFQKLILQLQEGGVRLYFYYDKLCMGSISLPQIEEQRKIGKLFDDLDNLIALQQRKCDKLQNIKETCLEKMFPKDGSNVPEIRFRGFTGDWGKRKLATLCEKFTDGDWIEAKDQSNFGFRLIQTGNIGVAEFLDKPESKRWISQETFERLHCEEVLPGDILISRLPEPAGRACIVPFLGTNMITAVDCTIVRPSDDCYNKFLLQYLSSQQYFSVVKAHLAGGTRQRISRSNLADIDVPIPKDRAEQEQIGNHFDQLDKLITLHQRKLEKLKNLKKAFLEKMFV